MLNKDHNITFQTPLELALKFLYVNQTQVLNENIGRLNELRQVVK